MNLDAAVAEMVENIGPINREPTGIKDIKGKEIHTGDIVEFFFSADTMRYTRSKKGNSPEGSRCRDIVIKEDDGIFYATCVFGGCRLSRLAGICEIIGTDPKMIDG